MSSVDALVAVGDGLERAADDLHDRFFERLRQLGSPLLDDPVAVQQLAQQAVHIVANVVATTRGQGYRRVEKGALSRTIGEYRAHNRVDPGESWRAAGVLFDTIGEIGFALIPIGPGAPALCAQLASVTNAVIGERMTDAWDAYAGALLREIHDAQNTERLRMARDLHDHVGHGLSAAQRNLELQEVYHAAGDPREVEAGAVALAMVVQAMQSMHVVIDHMRVGDSVHSMQSALKEFVDTMQPIEPEIVVSVNGDDRWVPHQVANESFLIVREAMRNAIEHAHAAHVTVIVDIAPSRLRATVVDDGAGFDAGALVKWSGIQSMHERAALIDGAMRVTSCRESGTQIELVVYAASASATT